MESIFGNPGLHLISEYILELLDHDSVVACHKAFDFRSPPNFWLKKCLKSGLPYDLYLRWKVLIQVTEDTDLEDHVSNLLAIMHREAPFSFLEPLFMASKDDNDFVILKFMVKNMPEFVQMQLEFTGIANISDWIMFPIFKILTIISSPNKSRRPKEGR